MLVRGADITFAAFDGAMVDDGDDGFTLDLERTRFIDSYGLVALACLIEDARLSGRSVTFVSPGNSNCRNYMARMRFADLLNEAGVQHGLPAVSEQALPGRLVEVTPFETSNDVMDLATIVYRRLSDSYRTRIVAGELYEALVELCGNALEHAGRDRGFVAAQVYNRGKPTQYIVFAIGDAGIGIRQSLSAAGFRPRDDAQAVSLALQNDVSASVDPGRGQGLPDVVGLLRDVSGRVLVRTGQARVLPQPHRQHEQRVSQLNGTIVAARVACGVSS